MTIGWIIFIPVRLQMVRANPGEGLNIPIWLLGTSMFSDQLAVDWGSPFAYTSHFAPAYLESAANLYLEKFQPSKTLDNPYVMAAVNIFATDTQKEAIRLFTSVQLMALGMIRRNNGLLLHTVNNMDSIWNSRNTQKVKDSNIHLLVNHSQLRKV